jgi:hypothetical protein
VPTNIRNHNLEQPTLQAHPFHTDLKCRNSLFVLPQLFYYSLPQRQRLDVLLTAGKLLSSVLQLMVSLYASPEHAAAIPSDAVLGKARGALLLQWHGAAAVYVSAAC